MFPVILAGGSGTRLWPLSRKNFPKQFLRLQGESSLLQQTMARVMTLPLQKTLVVSSEAHYFLCQEQLQAFATEVTYLLEPCARNTAPAIASAAHYLAQTFGRDAVMLILPSDHWMSDDHAFGQAMLQGAQYAMDERVLVTFGITPSSPKTGYGYIEAAELLTSTSVQVVKNFHEKPDIRTAESFLASGRHFWNSGMFVCQAGTYLDELERFAPDIFQQSLQAFDKAHQNQDYVRLDAKAYADCRSESIDYAVMERTQHAVVIPLNMPWSDLGCWTAVAEANPLDADGNALHGNVIAKDSHNCLVSSEDILVTTLGVHDHIIVATADAVLVADKRYSQQVKDIVSALAENHSPLADDHVRVARPWGYFEILAEGPTFKVKRLMVHPGAKLSLQMHQHRSEHWVVVGGEAEVVNDDRVLRLAVNQSTYIPQKIRHRLSNAGTEPLFVIEVQSGCYLGEDDITRFDDIYRRETTAEPA